MRVRDCAAQTANLALPAFWRRRSQQLHGHNFSVAVTDSCANAESAAHSKLPAGELVRRWGERGLEQCRVFFGGGLQRKKHFLPGLSENSMVRRSRRRRAPQWDSGMPMVPLKSRECGDVWLLFLSLLDAFFAQRKR